MRFGFTGSTGGARNEQTICLLGENLQPFAADDIASVPANSSKVIDVEANDNDPDGDVLHVPVIIDPAKNGSAVIFDSLGINYLRYTPNPKFYGTRFTGLCNLRCKLNQMLRKMRYCSSQNQCWLYSIYCGRYCRFAKYSLHGYRNQ